jgi:hypothetical protein
MALYQSVAQNQIPHNLHHSRDSWTGKAHVLSDCQKFNIADHSMRVLRRIKQGGVTDVTIR